MNAKVKDIFINLPVKDLDKSKAFFHKMGFEFNEDFCDEHGCSMILGDHIYAMLLTEEFFKSFTKSNATDTKQSNEVILAIMMNSPEEMEKMMQAGLDAGGKNRSTPLSPEEEEMMQYYRLEDLDGHLWEITYMEMDMM